MSNQRYSKRGDKRRDKSRYAAPDKFERKRNVHLRKRIKKPATLEEA